MKRILGIALIAVSTVSCEKPADDDYTITTVVVDWDTQTPVAGAKVYSSPSYYPVNPNTVVDSGLTDAAGRIVFTHPRNEVVRTIHVKKDGYDYPVYSPIYVAPQTNQDRMDTFFLAKTSWLDVQLHRSNTYMIGDLLHVWIEGYRRNKFVLAGGPFTKVNFYYHVPRAAIAADSTLHIPSVYFAPPYQKAYINWQVNRNGMAVASGVDSTDMVQYGVKNYTLNY